MARLIRDNPSILGRDPVDYAVMGTGAVAAAFVNDKFLAPVVKQTIPGPNNAENTMAKLVDAGTTLGSGWALSKGIGLVSRRWSSRVFDGAFLLSIMKALGSIIPNFGLSAEYPSLQGLLQIGVNSGATPPALKQPAAGTVTAPAAKRLSASGL